MNEDGVRNYIYVQYANLVTTIIIIFRSVYRVINSFYLGTIKGSLFVGWVQLVDYIGSYTLLILVLSITKR